MLSEVFWVAFITTISGMLIKLASMAYKSKCKEVVCGCFKIIRDTELDLVVLILFNYFLKV